MELVAFSLAGYKRFVEKTSVKLFGNMIAVVGPNEAGKSSLLRAIAHLHDGHFTRDERPRRRDVVPELTWLFQVDDEDREALAEVVEAVELQRVSITRSGGGAWTWALTPNPTRSTVERKVLAEELTRRADDALLNELDPLEGADYGDRMLEIAELLRASVESYSQEQLELFADLADIFERVSAGELQRRDPDTDRLVVTWLPSLADSLRGTIAAETRPSPWARATDLLVDRLPRIEVFDAEDRDLASQYDLVDIADSPPRALMHLAALAGLNLPALRDEAADGRVADVSTRRDQANRLLLEKFEQGWNQSGAAIQLEVQGTVLHIQVNAPDGYSPLEERSEGMRWFAALLAYANGWRGRPIVLMDEIETHLHHDAQIDLVRVLTEQSFTSKLIYTTHSFASLPYDLGTGVRVVEVIDESTSRLENGFWKGGAGFTPLMAAMGAAATSFTPTRYAIVAEGPSDAILLPTLLRQACGLRELPFQVAPGVSSVASASVPSLDAEAGRVAFVVDGDRGGRQNARKLADAGVATNRIVILESGSDAGLGFEVEDLVDPTVYLAAVNAELKLWNPDDNSEAMTERDLAANPATEAVELYCKSRGLEAPDKVAVAQRVVDESAASHVFRGDRAALIAGLMRQLTSALGISPAP